MTGAGREQRERDAGARLAFSFVFRTESQPIGWYRPLDGSAHLG